MQAIELFAGAGGLGMGISKAGFTPAKIVEWDRWCCDTIRMNKRSLVQPVAHWPEPTEGDVREVDFRPWEDRVALVTGGPPCQPFSLGGKHQAYDDKRDMWPQAVRAVREVRPKAFIFENVKGLTRLSFATYLSYIVLQLENPEVVKRSQEDWRDHLDRLEQLRTSGRREGLHYNVIYEVLNAADYGVPQRRERVVFVGFRSDIGRGWNFPKPTHSLEALLWQQWRSETYWDRHQVSRSMRVSDQAPLSRAMKIVGQPRTKAWRTVRDAISDLPDPQSLTLETILNHRFQGGAKSYPGHTGSPLDEPAKTLKAGVHGVPGGENMLARPDGTVRYFTVRESARLQTFPDDYVLHGSWTEAMRQLGNAVPVELARVVANDVAKMLRLAS